MIDILRSYCLLVLGFRAFIFPRLLAGATTPGCHLYASPHLGYPIPAIPDHLANNPSDNSFPLFARLTHLQQLGNQSPLVPECLKSFPKEQQIPQKLIAVPQNPLDH